jgi:hypothetical protein
MGDDSIAQSGPAKRGHDWVYEVGPLLFDPINWLQVSAKCARCEETWSGLLKRDKWKNASKARIDEAVNRRANQETEDCNIRVIRSMQDL